MDPNCWAPFDPAVAGEEWDRRSDPLPEPRRNGRRMSGSTIEDRVMPIIDGGRKYQGYMPGEYMLPIDGAEQDRLDFNHQFFKILLDGRLSVVPFEEPPRSVLDIGTGTGIWALEWAEQNPASHVYGTDLSRIQPDTTMQNLTWILENSEKHEWSYYEPLHYIHLRATGPCFDDMGTVLRKCYENLRPGGWIELQDGAIELRCDDASTFGTSIADLFWALNNGAQKLGRDLLRPKSFRAYHEDAGFVNIQIIEFAVPGSPWPADPKMKLCGYYMARALHNSVDSYSKFLEAAGLTPDEIVDLTSRLERDLSRVDIHWYIPCYVAMAQKPFSPSPFNYVCEGQYPT